MFCWGLDPPTGLSNEVPAVGGRYPPIERSSRRWGAVPPRHPPRIRRKDISGNSRIVWTGRSGTIVVWVV